MKNLTVKQTVDLIYIESALSNEYNIKLAQAGSITETLKNFIITLIKDNYEADKPLSSVFAFLTSGVAFSLNPVLGVFFIVAEMVFGVDFKKLWNVILKPIDDAIANKIPVTDTMIASSVQNGVESTLAPSENPEGLAKLIKERGPEVLEVAKKYSSYSNVNQDLRSAILINKFANNLLKKYYVNDKIINIASFKKEASFLRGGLVKFFIKIFSWLIRTALTSLALVGTGTVVTKTLGIYNKDSDAARPQSKPSLNFNVSNVVGLTPNIVEDFGSKKINSETDPWIVNIALSNLSQELSNWVVKVYPQFDKSDVLNSDSLNKMVSFIHESNKDNQFNGLTVVPQQFHYKLEIVNAIANGLPKPKPEITYK